MVDSVIRAEGLERVTYLGFKLNFAKEEELQLRVAALAGYAVMYLLRFLLGGNGK